MEKDQIAAILATFPMTSLLGILWYLVDKGARSPISKMAVSRAVVLGLLSITVALFFGIVPPVVAAILKVKELTCCGSILWLITAGLLMVFWLWSLYYAATGNMASIPGLDVVAAPLANIIP